MITLGYLIISRLRSWLSPRWPDLPDDIHQSIDEQTRARTKWINDHRRQQ